MILFLELFCEYNTFIGGKTLLVSEEAAAGVNHQREFHEVR